MAMFATCRHGDLSLYLRGCGGMVRTDQTGSWAPVFGAGAHALCGVGPVFSD
ncbi:hypothetical protein Csa_020211 [Cucumis sativus]|uniref:Uncharacterized protein n=1 Tax=Cucumis sativus TaxID=3659 RepID=A0A0A0K1B0_CUCSA|nr:hypothetical protein Csa_020211 [Cucumis sativus]